MSQAALMVSAVLFFFMSSTLLGQVETRAQTGRAPQPAADAVNARASLEQAKTYAARSERKLAIEAAQKAERLGNDDPAILQDLANFYVGLIPDHPKAAALGARYAELSPQDHTAWRRLAAFCLSTGQPEQAIAAGLRALRAEDSADLHKLLGTAYGQRKDWANAIAQFQAARELNRFDEDAHFRLAQVYLFQQDFAAAITVLEAARKVFDKSPQIELALGVALYGLRQFPGAVDQFLKTAKLAPDVPQPYIFLGRILDHTTDRLPEVIEQFRRFEAGNPQSHLGYLLHAKALILQLPPAGFPPEAQQAMDLVEKSIALKDDEAEAHLHLGVLLDRKKEYTEAAAHLERSAQLNPNDPAVHYRLARVYDRLGRKEEAAQQRALHEKLSEQEQSGGALPVAIDSPSPSQGVKK